jgi:hypothetical protein
MRSFYTTQKHFRAFILGTPEGWQVSIYDLAKGEWVERKGTTEGTLKNAKSTAHEKIASLLGKNPPALKWH